MIVEAETTLQPSLHTTSEYAELVFAEAECRGIDVADLRAELSLRRGKFPHEIIDDTLDRISSAGFANIEADDTLLIWPKGVEVPAE